MSVAQLPPVPKTLPCPHCGAQMNLTGRGTAPGSVVYFCRSCVPVLQAKELYFGQVVRTGNRDFGFVQLRGLQGLGSIRFWRHDCLDPATGRRTHTPPRVGNPCLVLLADGASQVHKLWSLRPPQPANNQAANARRYGVITALKAPDWGFITEIGTGVAFFLHQSELVGGGTLVVGRQVTFLPALTPKGRKAQQVRYVGR